LAIKIVEEESPDKALKDSEEGKKNSSSSASQAEVHDSLNETESSDESTGINESGDSADDDLVEESVPPTAKRQPGKRRQVAPPAPKAKPGESSGKNNSHKARGSTPSSESSWLADLFKYFKPNEWSNR
jgi:hypothetical protein